MVDYDSLINDTRDNQPLIRERVPTRIYTSSEYSKQNIFERDRISLARTIFMPTCKEIPVINGFQQMHENWTLLTQEVFNKLPNEIQCILHHARDVPHTPLTQLKEPLLRYEKYAQQDNSPPYKKQKYSGDRLEPKENLLYNTAQYCNVTPVTNKKYKGVKSCI